MSTPRPVLLAVDDDQAALSAIEGELHKRYGANYEVICAASPEAGLGRLEQLRDDGGQLGLVLADQRMPTMSGTEFPQPGARPASWGAAGGADQLG